MSRISRFFAPLALAAGIAGVIALVAPDASGQPPFGRGQFGKGQPPFGKGFPGKAEDKKDDKKVEEKKVEGKRVEEKKVEGKKGEERKGPAPKSDATVDAWVTVLVAKIVDPHDTVRDSARGALVAVGPPALPALQALADGNDPAKAVAARKLIGAIQGNRGPREAQGPTPAQPGRPGFGFGPPNFPGMGPMGRPNERERGPEPKRGERERERPVAPMPRAK